MCNFDTTSSFQSGLKLYFSTNVLSDESLKACVASEIKSLGVLVEPDFAKQVAEGKGLTLRRVYCYELALCCDLKVTTHVHYTTLEKRKTGEWNVSKTYSGNYKVEEVEKLRFVEYDRDETYNLSNRFVGMKCMIYPDSKFNSIIAQENAELNWANDLLDGRLNYYSTQPRIEYGQIGDFFDKLPNDKIMSILTSERAYRKKPSNTSINEVFKNMSISDYYLEKSVARIGVAKYYVNTSYKGQNYHLEINNKGELVLEKSTFPMPNKLYSESKPLEELHKLFVDGLKAEGEKVDKDFLDYVSKIENVKITLKAETSYVSRVRLDLEAVSNGKRLSKYLGNYFVSYSCKSKKPTTDVLLAKLKKGLYSVQSTCLEAEEPLAVPDFNSFINLNANKFPTESEELKDLFPTGSSVYTSIKKTNTSSIIKVADVTEYVYKTIFEGVEYVSIFSVQNKKWVFHGYRRTQAGLNVLASEIEKNTKKSTIAMSVIWISVVFGLILLALWQCISFWWLGRYDFIESGAQNITIHIVTWVRLLILFVCAFLIPSTISCSIFNPIKALRLCKKCKQARATKQEIDFLARFLAIRDDSNADLFGLVAWIFIASLIHLIPFIIFIFV